MKSEGRRGRVGDDYLYGVLKEEEDHHHNHKSASNSLADLAFRFSLTAAGGRPMAFRHHPPSSIGLSDSISSTMMTEMKVERRCVVAS